MDFPKRPAESYNINMLTLRAFFYMLVHHAYMPTTIKLRWNIKEIKATVHLYGWYQTYKGVSSILVAKISNKISRSFYARSGKVFVCYELRGRSLN